MNMEGSDLMGRNRMRRSTREEEEAPDWWALAVSGLAGQKAVKTQILGVKRVPDLVRE